MSCCAAGTNGCYDLRCRAFTPGERVRAEWRRRPGPMARRAEGNVTPLWRSSAGWLPARMGRLFSGVGRRHLVTIRKASLMTGSMRVQYSVEWIMAKLALRNVVAPASQPEPASRLNLRVRHVMSDFCEVTRGDGDTWASCPTLLRGIWVRSSEAGFRSWSWLSDHV